MKFFFILTSLVLLFSCKKHKQPEMADVNENCNCATEVSADFVMEEMTTGNLELAKYTSTDILFGDRNVRFVASEANAEYTWYIGSEILHESTVKRYFGSELSGQIIPITLVTRKSPNSICFPNDDGYDSIVKYLTIAQSHEDISTPPGDSTFMEGTYRVKSPLLSDSIDIIVDYKYYSSFGKHIDIYNYDGLGSNCLATIGLNQFNYRQFWIDPTYTSQNNCADMRGSFLIKMNGEAELSFISGGYVNGIYNPTLNDWQYRGRKLP